MKKTQLTALFVSLVLSATLFAGCGSSDNDANSTGTGDGDGDITVSVSDAVGTPGIPGVEEPMEAFSEGLSFALTEAGDSYAVVGIGTCEDREIVIPATHEGLPVTEIGERAFKQTYRVKSVVIPRGVTRIGNYAFDQCERMTTVVIPAGVTSIGYGAFSSCKSLTRITIPEGVTCIGQKAFEECVSLTEVTIPGSVTRIEKNAFYRCIKLPAVVLPEGVEELEKMAFAGCQALTEVSLPRSLKSLYDDSFGLRGDVNFTYAGTTDEWKKVRLEDTFNYIHFPVIHCADGDFPEQWMTGKN